jgi:ABC-type multidrug transport system ATPase subunit
MAASGPPEPAIRVEHLTKRFGSLVAVDDLSFEVGRGQIFGLLGSNGAGKTTTLKVLTGLLRPDRGTARVDGVDVLRRPVEAKRRIGFLPEAPALYDQLTAREFLEMIGTLRGMEPGRLDKRIGELLDMMELSDFSQNNIGTFSRGMRQKLAFASAVVHEPRILILDEPLSGLDPRFGKFFKGWIREHSKNGGSVLMSTHVTSNAEELCDRVAVIDRGRVLLAGSVDEVLEGSGTRTLEDAFVALVGGSRWQRSPSLPQTR